MWEAIMDRREVAVLEKGLMMGPELFRNTLELLLLDRVYLEEYFGGRINLEAHNRISAKRKYYQYLRACCIRNNRDCASS